MARRVQYTPTMSNTTPKQVTVKPSKYNSDGYSGPMFVIERQGDEYGLARSANFDYAEVWIHKQRIEE